MQCFLRPSAAYTKALEDAVAALKEIAFDIDITDREYSFDVCYFSSGMIVRMMNSNSYDASVMSMLVSFRSRNLLRDIKTTSFYYQDFIYLFVCVGFLLFCFDKHVVELKEKLLLINLCRYNDVEYCAKLYRHKVYKSVWNSYCSKSSHL